MAYGWREAMEILKSFRDIDSLQGLALAADVPESALFIPGRAVYSGPDSLP